MANTDKDKERKVKADRTEAKVKSDRQKSFYTKQRKQAEEGASEGDTKAKTTRDKIYSKIGRKPGPDADDADVVNKGALDMVGGIEALGADSALGLGRMALGKVGAKIGREGLGKIAGDVMSKFGKGGKTADKAAPKTVASGRTVKATAKGIDKGSRGHKALGNHTMKQAPMKIDGQKGATAMARKSVKGGKSPSAKAAVKSSTSGVESASTKRMKEYDGIGKDKIASKTVGRGRPEAAKKIGAANKAAAKKEGAQALKDAKKNPAKATKTKAGPKIDGQTGKTMKSERATKDAKKAPTKSKAKKKS